MRTRPTLLQFGEEGDESVGGKLRSVKCGRGQAAERVGDFCGGDGPSFIERFSDEELGERGSGSDGRDTALSFETHGRDFAGVDANREAKNVAANGIRDVHCSGGIREIAGVARILEMIDDSSRVHHKKYGKASAEIQRGIGGKMLP